MDEAFLLPKAIFLDTSFFVALANESDRDHAQTLSLLDRIRKGEFGQPYTSDYVFDESVSTTLIRTGRMDKAIKAGRLILGNREQKILPLARLLRLDEKEFGDAWANLCSPKFKDRRLSFTDHTILVLMSDFKIETLASLDSGFDGLLSRVF